MAGYLKRIALIKTVGKGFSSDGGQLGGLVKCEVYAGFLKVELSLINFAPLSEGRYRYGISDGTTVVTFENSVFETETEFDLSRGFAALVCFINGGVIKSVASAVCGDNFSCLAAIERAISEEERAAEIPQPAAYEDEAIAEVNYYELETCPGGGTVREDKKKEADGRAGGEDEEDFRAVEGALGEREFSSRAGREKGGIGGEDMPIRCAAEINGEKPQHSEVPDGERADFAQSEGRSELNAQGETDSFGEVGGERERADADGFYKRMERDVKKIFSDYPKEERLERVIEGSRWAKVGYGGGKYYAFGVIYSDGEARYLCYGVPSADGNNCPRSLTGRASYVPVEGGGYWIMYQDARTGISIKIDVS